MASKQLNNKLYRISGVIIIILSIIFGIRELSHQTMRVEPGYFAYFMDVGQGDSALIQCGEAFVLIDAGPTDASNIVTSMLKEHGVTHLDAVIATHPHEDHIGGMGSVLKNFSVGAFYLPDKSANTQSFSQMIRGLEAQGLAPIVPTPGDVFTVGGITFTFISPNPNDKYENTNNFSLVTIIDTGAQRLLFAGDAEIEIENALVDAGKNLSCDIYKVSHHGSRTSSSSAFLQELKARIAVISCGKDNSYGHPHEEVLQRLQSAGIETIYITADSGTVILPLELPAHTEPKENAA